MIARLIRLVRGNADDNLEVKTETKTYTTSLVFTLLQDNANSLLNTLIDGAVLAQGESATLDTSTNQVTLVASLVAGQEVQYKFNYYSNFSDSQIKAAIESALSYISLNGIQDFYYDISSEEITPYLSKKEEYLTALIAAIILKPNYSKYKTSTIEINYPENLSKDEKIKNIIKDFKSGTSLIFGII